MIDSIYLVKQLEMKKGVWCIIWLTFFNCKFSFRFVSFFLSLVKPFKCESKLILPLNQIQKSPLHFIFQDEKVHLFYLFFYFFFLLKTCIFFSSFFLFVPSLGFSRSCYFENLCRVISLHRVTEYLDFFFSPFFRSIRRVRVECCRTLLYTCNVHTHTHTLMYTRGRLWRECDMSCQWWMSLAFFVSFFSSSLSLVRIMPQDEEADALNLLGIETCIHNKFYHAYCIPVSSLILS